MPRLIPEKLPKKCKTCRNYVRAAPLEGGDPDVVAEGMCHRYPEAVPVLGSHWCAEWTLLRSGS